MNVTPNGVTQRSNRIQLGTDPGAGRTAQSTNVHDKMRLP